jgi:ATP-dependent Clp protease ATP-binding subunit ClpB
MNLNNLTTKALEAVSASQQEAFNNGNPQLDTLHLLKSMLDVDQDSLPFVLEKAGVNRNILLGKVEEKLKTLPKVSGQAADIVPSPGFSKLILQANKLLKEFEDSYVSVELLLLAMLAVGDDATKVLKDSGLEDKKLRASILELRKGSKVNEQSADAKYNSLDKYAIKPEYTSKKREARPCHRS